MSISIFTDTCTYMESFLLLVFPKIIDNAFLTTDELGVYTLYAHVLVYVLAIYTVLCKSLEPPQLSVYSVSKQPEKCYSDLEQ